MNEVLTTSKRPAAPLPLTFGRAANILWECAWEALILAFLVQVFGSIAVGAVGGLLEKMLPSLPPGFSGGPRESAWNLHFFQRHQFLILLGIFWVAKIAGSLARHSRNQVYRNRAAWGKRISRTISERWFSSVVGNAFIAFAAVILIQIMQQFSWTHWLWQSVFEWLRSAVYGVGRLFPAGIETALKDLFGWYDANQFKFMFWLFYSSAICDDLGLPNYKTLGRLLWRRIGSGGKSPASSPARPSEPGDGVLKADGQ